MELPRLEGISVTGNPSWQQDLDARHGGKRVVVMPPAEGSLALCGIHRHQPPSMGSDPIHRHRSHPKAPTPRMPGTGPSLGIPRLMGLGGSAGDIHQCGPAVAQLQLPGFAPWSLPSSLSSQVIQETNQVATEAQNCKTSQIYPKSGCARSSCAAPGDPGQCPPTSSRMGESHNLRLRVGTREHPNPSRCLGTDTPRPGPFTPSPNSTGHVLPPHPMLVKTPSPKIQLRINPSHAGAVLPTRERGSPRLGGIWWPLSLGHRGRWHRSARSQQRPQSNFQT